jgi:pyruvate formate lyase activating enzyme
MIINSGINHEFRTTVVKEQLSTDDILEILKAIKGANTYYLQNFVPTKVLNPEFKKKSCYQSNEIENLKQEAELYVKSFKVR